MKDKIKQNTGSTNEKILKIMNRLLCKYVQITSQTNLEKFMQ